MYVYHLRLLAASSIRVELPVVEIRIITKALGIGLLSFRMAADFLDFDEQWYWALGCLLEGETSELKDLLHLIQ